MQLFILLVVILVSPCFDVFTIHEFFFCVNRFIDVFYKIHRLLFMIHFMNYKIYFLRTARNDAINAVIGTVNTTPKTSR